MWYMHSDFLTNEIADASNQGMFSKTPSPKQTSARARCRVLVADDHAGFRKCLVEFLKETTELDVIADAQDGQQAVDMTLMLHPDVVIMDLDMPRMNGIEATRKIAGIFPDIRIICISMHLFTDEAEVLAAGAARYLPKSGPVEDLLAAIQC
jgi:two-component system response regulator DegU